MCTGGRLVTSGRAAAVCLLGLAALLVAAGVSSAWSGASRIAGRPDDAGGERAAAAAADFVAGYGTFDYRDPEGYTARLAALTTGELHRAIAAAGIDGEAAGRLHSIAAAVESSEVVATSGEAAEAVVVAVQSRRWAGAPGGPSALDHVRQRVSVRLVREEGRWLVSGMRLLWEQPATAGGAR